MMGSLDLVAVVIACLTALAYHALRLRYHRQMRGDLVAERQEDARLAAQESSRIAVAQACEERILEHLGAATLIEERAQAAKTDMAALTAAVDGNMQALRERLVTCETALGWGKKS